MPSRSSSPSPYDHRPDDLVVAEAKRGEAFLKTFRLLSSRPDFSGAVDEINRLTASRPSGLAPRASIVIPVYGQLGYTLNCLHSLVPDIVRGDVEVLIGDDASPDGSARWLAGLHHIRYIRHETNGGFIRNCNLTASEVTAPYIVLLNNDTRVVPGWLDAMLESFTLFTDAGLIGAKLFYPDGSLQEAGGIVWLDGSAWNYGRDDDPNRPRYCHARRVDYVSGCAIALPIDDWRVLGGFDSLYTPAYYEDTDIAFRLRQGGRSTWMQPLARVIHYEGMTSGTDLTSGAKAYQVQNSQKFRHRWASTLASHRKNGVDPWLERDRDTKKRVLVIDTVNPTPDQDAGSAATVALIRAYIALGYHVLFVPEDNFLYDPQATTELQRIGVECLYAPYENSLTTLLTRYGPYLSVVHLIRPETAKRALDLVKTYVPQARLIYLNADLHFLRLERQAEVEGRRELLAEAGRMKEVELGITSRVDTTFVHSHMERDLLSQMVPMARVEVMPLIHTLVGRQSSFTERQDVMFLGGYNHPPNVDAALWLIDGIWPSVAEACPQARLLIVGANPPQALLEKASDRVIVTGRVDDLAPWFERTRVFVAPLRYGAGAKGKVVTAMAHGVPVIASPIAAEGMGFVKGRDLLVAETPVDLAESIVSLYNGPETEWLRLADNGLNRVRDGNGLDAVVAALEAVLNRP